MSLKIPTCGPPCPHMKKNSATSSFYSGLTSFKSYLYVPPPLCTTPRTGKSSMSVQIARSVITCQCSRIPLSFHSLRAQTHVSLINNVLTNVQTMKADTGPLFSCSSPAIAIRLPVPPPPPPQCLDVWITEHPSCPYCKGNLNVVVPERTATANCTRRVTSFVAWSLTLFHDRPVRRREHTGDHVMPSPPTAMPSPAAVP